MIHQSSKICILGFFLCFPLSFRCLNSKSECISPSVSITQKIDHLGFHRDINWLIETHNFEANSWHNLNCHLILKFDAIKGIFVNPDQVQDLTRLGKLNATIVGDVDVEAPAHEALEHSAYIFLDDSHIPGQINVKLPIHLRYQRSLMGGHIKVKLNRPLLLAHCPKSSKICENHKKVNIPMGPKDFEWRNITYQAHFGDVELLVPVGNLEDYGYVAVGALIVGCAGCIYLISLLSP